jgi:hypothetical protein
MSTGEVEGAQVFRPAVAVRHQVALTWFEYPLSALLVS